MTPPLPKVVLLILTWNRRDDVLRCVASLEHLNYSNLLPVVIDNASEDDSVAALQERYPDLTVLRNPTNRGYAGGNNVGVRWAKAHGAEYVQIINSDTEVTPELVRLLVDVASADPRVGVVGCRNLLMEDPTRLWGAYGILDYGPFLVRTAGRGELDGPAWQTVRDVDWVIGNGYLWRVDSLDRIGLLDESFFGYHEDVDWCVRARRAGYRVVYAGSAAIIHRGGSSSEFGQARRFPSGYFLGRNGPLFVRKHANLMQGARFFVLYGAAALFRWLRALTFRLAPRGSRARERAAEWMIFETEFLRGGLDAMAGREIPFRSLGLEDTGPSDSG